MTTTYSYFEKKTAPTGSTLYYSTLFSPAEIRHAVIALHAFYQELAEIGSKDPQVISQQLEWWHAEINRLAEQQPRHPITQALLPIIQQFQIPIDILHSLIDHPDTEHIVKLTALYIPGGDQAKLAPYAQHLSQALQLIDHIINLRKILPPGETPPSLTEFTQQAQQAKEHYQKAREALPSELRRTQLHQIIFAELQLKLLAEIQKDGFNVLTHKTNLTPLRKLWIAWRVQHD